MPLFEVPPYCDGEGCTLGWHQKFEAWDRPAVAVYVCREHSDEWSEKVDELFRRKYGYVPPKPH